MPQSRIIGIEYVYDFIIILGPAASHLHNNLIKLCVFGIEFLALKITSKVVWEFNINYDNESIC